jgi:hypothetical protein
MTDRVTPMQTLIVWSLLAEGGVAFSSDLPGKAPDRRALKSLGLVAETREKRKTRVEVTERGWAWAAEHLDREISRSSASASILRGWLTRLKHYLASNPNVALATVLVPPKATAPAELYANFRARVRDAYLVVTHGQYNARALLRDLRSELANVDRADLDAEFRRLQSEEGASLMPLDNRAAITPADEEAAISVGGEARHLIWIAR